MDFKAIVINRITKSMKGNMLKSSAEFLRNEFNQQIALQMYSGNVPVIPTHQNTVHTSILLKNGFLKIKLQTRLSVIMMLTWYSEYLNQ